MRWSSTRLSLHQLPRGVDANIISPENDNVSTFSHCLSRVYAALARGADPEEVRLFHNFNLGVTGDQSAALIHGRGQRETIGIGNRIPSLKQGRFKDNLLRSRDNLYWTCSNLLDRFPRFPLSFPPPQKVEGSTYLSVLETRV